MVGPALSLASSALGSFFSQPAMLWEDPFVVEVLDLFGEYLEERVDLVFAALILFAEEVDAPVHLFGDPLGCFSWWAKHQQAVLNDRDLLVGAVVFAGQCPCGALHLGEPGHVPLLHCLPFHGEIDNVVPDEKLLLLGVRGVILLLPHPGRCRRRLDRARRCL